MVIVQIPYCAKQQDTPRHLVKIYINIKNIWTSSNKAQNLAKYFSSLDVKTHHEMQGGPKKV